LLSRSSLDSASCFSSGCRNSTSTNQNHLTLL